MSWKPLPKRERDPITTLELDAMLATKTGPCGSTPGECERGHDHLLYLACADCNKPECFIVYRPGGFVSIICPRCAKNLSDIKVAGPA